MRSSQTYFLGRPALRPMDWVLMLLLGADSAMRFGQSLKMDLEPYWGFLRVAVATEDIEESRDFAQLYISASNFFSASSFPSPWRARITETPTTGG